LIWFLSISVYIGVEEQSPARGSRDLLFGDSRSCPDSESLGQITIKVSGFDGNFAFIKLAFKVNRPDSRSSIL